MSAIIGAFLSDYPNAEHYQAYLMQEAERRGFAVRFLEYATAQPEDLEGVSILFGHPSADLIRSAKGLKLFFNCWAGMDAYTQEDFAGSPGCCIANASGAYGLMIAEHVVMGLLMLLHRQREYDALISAGEWRRVEGTIGSIRGKRVTILGTGDIGTEVARRLRPFGPARLTGISRSGRQHSLFDAVFPVEALDLLLQETDVLICAIPGTTETKGMLDKKRLALLPQGALLVNVGRGSLVDQEAMTEMLQAHTLAGAVIDVTVPEPLPAAHPLRQMEHVILTPHIAGSLVALPYTCTKTVEMFLEDLDHFIAGEPLAHGASLAAGY